MPDMPELGGLFFSTGARKSVRAAEYTSSVTNTVNRAYDSYSSCLGVVSSLPPKVGRWSTARRDTGWRPTNARWHMIPDVTLLARSVQRIGD
jgi:hypothetical protein